MTVLPCVIHDGSIFKEIKHLISLSANIGKTCHTSESKHWKALTCHHYLGTLVIFYVSLLLNMLSPHSRTHPLLLSPIPPPFTASLGQRITLIEKTLMAFILLSGFLLGFFCCCFGWVSIFNSIMYKCKILIVCIRHLCIAI